MKLKKKLSVQRLINSQILDSFFTNCYLGNITLCNEFDFSWHMYVKSNETLKGKKIKISGGE